MTIAFCIYMRMMITLLMPLIMAEGLPSYGGRTEDLGDQQHNCSLAIHDLQDNDNGYYFFGWHSKNSVHLSITELKVTVSPERVRAGDQVTLGCGESCKLPDTVWFRDGHPVTEPEFTAKAEDSGNYFCAVKGKESVQSDSVALDASHTGLYICQARNSVGQSNSTEVLLRLSQTDISNNGHIIRVGIGVVVGIVVLLLLVVITLACSRRWRRRNQSAVDKEEEHSNDYENVINLKG
ncbi:hypothetical protein INR49_012858 [Caranx melampygus]|nr:hypothetical protein INR49_012858 [Caranx melampygus]